MTGTFQIIPFLDSSGMNSIMQDFADAHLGKPFFKIDTQNNQVKVTGLLHGNIYAIILESLKNDAVIDTVFDSPVTTCFAKINHKASIAQVDIGKINQQ
ncbi:hypothetical protein [Commensalibacter nepenthis]|uniref:Uncharacterized protein n=1 Tax=Commensalibacter nepenthis TaxID=3043872 RepID=A0ABT6Q977_9PROT|nr:hypothetical protein [Commensalibacter sp. TBRC 10068]MDI2112860.1 hypothetical protein [Commensalibacter sp. TBRC 10068]